MGDIMGQLGQLGSSAMQGIGDVGGDLASGAQDLFSGVGTGLNDAFGLSGGGGAVSPGTLGGAASTIANAAPAAADVATDASAVAPGAASAASFGLPPGAAAAPAVNTPFTPLATAEGMGSGGTGLPSSSYNIPAVDTSGLDTNLIGGVPGVDANAQGGIGNGNFLQQLLGNKKALGAGTLGLSTLLGQLNKPSLSGVQGLEKQQAGLAQNQGELAQAEQQGLLPAGANQMFQGLLNSQLATIRQKYAQMGMTGSTAEMQDLNAARESVMAQLFQVGQTMAGQSWGNMQKATGVENTLLKQIYDAQVANSEGLGKSLANFAAAFTDMSGGAGT